MAEGSSPPRPRPVRWAVAGDEITVFIDAPPAAGETCPVGDQLARLIVDRGAVGVRCDVSGCVRPDLPAVDALARLHLLARRLGCELTIVGAGRELRALLTAIGLAALLR